MTRPPASPPGRRRFVTPAAGAFTRPYPGLTVSPYSRGTDPDSPGHVNDQPLLPESVRGTRFYEPGEHETAAAERLRWVLDAKRTGR